MNNAEQEIHTIHTAFDRLYALRYKVHNNLESLGSVEVVRTIREALKR